MKIIKGIGKFIWRLLLVLSVVVNLVLIAIVVALVLLIFDIKREIATPLVGGLHSSFVGLDEATIDWTIPVRAEVPVKLNIPLKQDTIVTLTQPVPISVTAYIDILSQPATVSLSLPAGLQLPVSLDLNVEVDDVLPVSLDVRAVIPLNETQLHDVADNLRLLFEPLAVGLENLPDDFGEAFTLVGNVLAGQPVNLLAQNEYTARPWPGFSRTAGLNYPQELLTAPWPEANRPLLTGITMIGGIRAFDEALRPETYAQSANPRDINTQAYLTLDAQGVPAQFYNGQFAEYRRLMRGEASVDITAPQDSTQQPVTVPTEAPNSDLGIIPTPTPQP